MFAETLFMVICAIYGKIKLKSASLEKYAGRVLMCASCVTAFNAAAMLMPTEKLSLTFFTLYNVYESLSVISLFVFVRFYIGKSTGLGRLKIPTVIMFFIDLGLLVLNIFNGCLFKVSIIGESFYRVSDMTVLYSFHAGFVMILNVLILGMLLHRILETPYIYIAKYGFVLLMLVAICTVSLSYMYLGFQLDYSILLYTPMSFVMFYYSLIYVPHGLMERLMYFTLAGMNDGIISIDIDGRIVQANKSAHDFCEADEEIKTLEEQINRWTSSEIPRGDAVHNWEMTRRVNGNKHHYTIEYRRIFDGSGKYLGCFFLIHDKTKEVTRLNAEKYRATHDQLTGLYNKDYFYEVVGNLLNDNPNENYVIIVTDVKNFKLVNDVFGVEEGDRLLRKISEITRKLGEKFSIFARLTGDRFALCMPKRRYSEDNLLSCYSSVDSFVKNSSFKVHIHIGVYEVTDRNIRVSVMCDRAALAIRTIKDSFRNRIAYFESEIRENFISDHRIISEFEVAIANGHFQPYIQPQISVNGNIRGGEVLVRWFHPTEGLIPPDKFIKILEQTGLISRLDKHMWELACKHLSRWNEQGYKKCYLSVNISQKDFYLLDVYEVITKLVQKYKVAPYQLHLEVTESAIMDNPETHLKLLEKLRRYGFIVEIDDFGSGYSSLNMLKDLDADVLKIDMGFLQETNNTVKSKTILKMIISLAKSLNMEVITEGVETIEQVNFLAEYGCDIYQGYYFAKPMPVEEFESGFLNKRFRMKSKK